jgi:hypothetical protein
MGGLVELVRASPLPDPQRSAELLSALIEGALLDQLSLPRDDFADGLLRPMLELAVGGLSAAATPSR